MKNRIKVINGDRTTVTIGEKTYDMAEIVSIIDYYKMELEDIDRSLWKIRSAVPLTISPEMTKSVVRWLVSAYRAEVAERERLTKIINRMIGVSK